MKRYCRNKLQSKKIDISCCFCYLIIFIYINIVLIGKCKYSSIFFVFDFVFLTYI